LEKNLIDYRYSLERITQDNRKVMKVSYKVWLEHHGKAFGDGPYELLRQVDKTKSFQTLEGKISFEISISNYAFRNLNLSIGKTIKVALREESLWIMP
jgi:hypothetical protein